MNECKKCKAREYDDSHRWYVLALIDRCIMILDHDHSGDSNVEDGLDRIVDLLEREFPERLANIGPRVSL